MAQIPFRSGLSNRCPKNSLRTYVPVIFAPGYVAKTSRPDAQVLTGWHSAPIEITNLKGPLMEEQGEGTSENPCSQDPDAPRIVVSWTPPPVARLTR